MKKDEAILTLFRIQSMLGLPQTSLGVIPGNIINRLQDLLDFKSKWDSIADQLSDYRQTLELGKYPEYAEQCKKRIFELMDKP